MSEAKKVEFKNSKTFTRKELAEVENVYDYILDTLLELKAPIKLLPKKSLTNPDELREMKIIAPMRREELDDFSLKYSW